jgi:hypothetical protein
MKRERPSWKVALQDRERRLGWANNWNDQHAVRVKFRKVSNGKRSEQTQHLL